MGYKYEPYKRKYVFIPIIYCKSIYMIIFMYFFSLYRTRIICMEYMQWFISIFYQGERKYVSWRKRKEGLWQFFDIVGRDILVIKYYKKLSLIFPNTLGNKC